MLGCTLIFNVFFFNFALSLTQTNDDGGGGGGDDGELPKII